MVSTPTNHKRHTMKNERELQAKCLKYARAQGVFARKVETPAFNGFPDCIFFYNGRCMLIEFKHPNGKGRLSPIQVKDHGRLLEVDVTVWVVEDYDIFTDLMEDFINDKRPIMRGGAGCYINSSHT